MRYRDEQWLRERLCEDGLTQREVATECDCSEATISKWKNRHDITVFRDYQDPDWLREHHREQNLGPTEIADRSAHDVSPAMVYTLLDEHDIVQRHRDAVWLREQYVDNECSSIKIAEKCDVCPQTILNNMEKFGIERRSYQEAGCIDPVFEGVTGEDHPFYGNTGHDHHWYMVTGPDHPSYVDGSSYEKWRDSHEWHRTREDVRQRDQYECQLCGDGTELEVHHITPVCRGGAKFDPVNLETLCGDCHTDVHSAIY